MTLKDFEHFFAEAGLIQKAVFGNYDLDDFDEENSQRLILLFQR